MKIIKNGTYVSVPYALRKLIENYVVDDKLQVQDFDPYNWADLLVGDHLLTDHSKEERIDKLEHLDTVLEGCVLTSDSNFFASGYLVK